MPENEPKTLQVQISPEQIRAMLNAPVPRLYANGFAVAQTAADISIVLLLNGAPAGVLTMSMTAAKTLVEQLNQPIGTYEKKTQSTIKTMEEVAAALGMQ